MRVHEEERVRKSNAFQLVDFRFLKEKGCITGEGFFFQTLSQTIDYC